jgi:hypothetical protein
MINQIRLTVEHHLLYLVKNNTTITYRNPLFSCNLAFLTCLHGQMSSTGWNNEVPSVFPPLSCLKSGELQFPTAFSVSFCCHRITNPRKHSRCNYISLLPLRPIFPHNHISLLPLIAHPQAIFLAAKTSRLQFKLIVDSCGQMMQDTLESRMHERGNNGENGLPLC